MGSRGRFLGVAALTVMAAACGASTLRSPLDGSAPPFDAAPSSPDVAPDVAPVDQRPPSVDTAPPDRRHDVAEVAPPKEVVAGPCGVAGGPTCPVTYAGAWPLWAERTWGIWSSWAPDGTLYLGGAFVKAATKPTAPNDLGSVSAIAPGGESRGTWTFAGGEVKAVSATAGALVVVGEFREEVDLDPGPGRDVRVNPASTLGFFAARLTAAGTFVWGRTLSSSQDGVIGWIGGAAAPDGATYLIGNYNGEVDFDPGPGTRAPMDARGAFIMRLDARGDLEWFRTLGGDGCHDTWAREIVLARDGMLWFSGSFQGGCALDHGGSVARGTSGTFLASLTPSGQERSLQTFYVDGFATSLSPARVTSDPVAVYFSSGTAVRGIDTAGTVVWTYSPPTGLSAMTVAATPQGGLLVAGALPDLADPMFVLALDAQRQESWRFQMGSGTPRPEALLANEKDFLVVGTKGRPLDDIDPSAAIDIVGGAPGFVARFTY